MENKTNNDLDQFYRGQVFGMIETRLDRMEKDSKEAYEKLSAQVEELRGQMRYVFGFAAAVGMGAAFIWDWIKSKL